MKYIYDLDEKLSAQFMIGFRSMLFINEAILFEIFDFVSKVKKSPYYRQKIKQLCNRVKVKTRNSNCNLCSYLHSGVDAYLDESDLFLARIKRNREILFYSIKNEFMKAVPDKADFAEMFAYIFLIQRLVDINRENMYDWLGLFASYGLEMQPDALHSLESTSVINANQLLIDETIRVFAIPKGSLMECKNTFMALKIYRKDLENLDYIMDAVEQVGRCKNKFVREEIKRPPHLQMPENLK